MRASDPGSTRRLIQLCVGYFASYVATGVLVKYFLNIRHPPMTEMGYLVNNTIGGSAFALLVVILLGWIRMKSNRLWQWGRLRIPSEAAYIVPSGVCTAIIIPTTTLMYSLPISVMVAMVIMRGSVIVISRVVDTIQIAQGILKKRVFAEENWAVVFAILAVATNVLLLPLVDALDAHGIRLGEMIGLQAGAGRGSFDFLHTPAALVILGSYITAYSIRIYIFNFFKNTRARGVPQDNKGFFAIEQVAASITMVAIGWFVFSSPSLLGWTDERVRDFHAAASHLTSTAVMSGIPFGIVAFFSVFIFMFQGRTATFAGLVNRLTSLLAGTTATLLMHYVFGLRLPSMQDWISVVFILVAVGFLSQAERKRMAERQLQEAAAGGAPLAAAGGTGGSR